MVLGFLESAFNGFRVPGFGFGALGGFQLCGGFTGFRV